jgi:hypothetical protein
VLFHHSATKLSPGTILVPRHADSPWGQQFYRADQKWRAGKVWMFGAPEHAALYGGSSVVYQVMPMGQVGVIAERAYTGDDSDLDAGIVGDQYYADSAVVLGAVNVLGPDK